MGSLRLSEGARRRIARASRPHPSTGVVGKAAPPRPPRNALSSRLPRPVLASHGVAGAVRFAREQPRGRAQRAPPARRPVRACAPQCATRDPPRTVSCGVLQESRSSGRGPRPAKLISFLMPETFALRTVSKLSLGFRFPSKGAFTHTRRHLLGTGSESQRHGLARICTLVDLGLFNAGL